jgi:copper chaperone
MSEIHTHASPSNTARSGCGCGCGANPAADRTNTAAEAHTGATGGYTTEFQVTGMTCGHCVGAVTGELTDSVSGVKDVQIDLPSGQVTVNSDQPVTEAAVAAAIEGAGYQLIPGSLRYKAGGVSS